MANTIQVRVDDDGFPFEIKRITAGEYNPHATMSEEEMLAKLEKSREHARQGKYRAAEDVVFDMREKYGL